MWLQSKKKKKEKKPLNSYSPRAERHKKGIGVAAYSSLLRVLVERQQMAARYQLF